LDQDLDIFLIKILIKEKNIFKLKKHIIFLNKLKIWYNLYQITRNGSSGNISKTPVRVSNTKYQTFFSSIKPFTNNGHNCLEASGLCGTSEYLDNNQIIKALND
jgi:hypothetical protein